MNTWIGFIILELEFTDGGSFFIMHFFRRDNLDFFQDFYFIGNELARLIVQIPVSTLELVRGIHFGEILGTELNDDVHLLIILRSQGSSLFSFKKEVIPTFKINSPSLQIGQRRREVGCLDKVLAHSTQTHKWRHGMSIVSFISEKQIMHSLSPPASDASISYPWLTSLSPRPNIYSVL